MATDAQLVSKLNTISDPMASQLDTLRDWLRDQKGEPFLSGYEAETWAENPLDRYMCLRAPSGQSDVFTAFVANVLLAIYHRTIGYYIGTGQKRDARTGHTSYSNSSINRVSNVITTILASLIPVLTIYILNQLSSVNLRIGVTAALTAAFALTLATFSSASRVEIFMATAT